MTKIYIPLELEDKSACLWIWKLNPLIKICETAQDETKDETLMILI